MWKEGNIAIPDGKGGHIICHYWIKVYEKPSKKYGIDGGRISKLTIKVNGKTTANYDRGWDIKPTDEATEMALQVLLLAEKDPGALLRQQLSAECSFRDALDARDGDRYPASELCYIRAYHDGEQWNNTVFPINWDLRTDELIKEADNLYQAFQRAFPDRKAVRNYVEHEAERGDDPTEGNAYLELEHGRYWLRMITRKGDYNLYIHVLSKTAPVEGGDDND